MPKSAANGRRFRAQQKRRTEAKPKKPAKKKTN